MNIIKINYSRGSGLGGVLFYSIFIQEYFNSILILYIYTVFVDKKPTPKTIDITGLKGCVKKLKCRSGVWIIIIWRVDSAYL